MPKWILHYEAKAETATLEEAIAQVEQNMKLKPMFGVEPGLLLIRATREDILRLDRLQAEKDMLEKQVHTERRRAQDLIDKASNALRRLDP